MTEKNKNIDKFVPKVLKDNGVDQKVNEGKNITSSDNNKLEVLTTSSVERLRVASKKNDKLISIPFDQLCSDYNLSFVKRYKYNDKINLKFPKVIGKNKKKYVFSMKESGDRENCSLISQILPDLSPADACDENLWVTLVFNQFNEYTQKRWKNPTKSMSKHWFASGWRQLTSDNAIARLWWVEHLSKKADPFSKNNLKDILLSTAEYRTTLLERPTSSRSQIILQSILEVTKEIQKKKGSDLSRDGFRNIMKEVGFVTKRRLINVLPKNVIKKSFAPIFQKGFK